jgi:hypothetical protein
MNLGISARWWRVAWHAWKASIVTCQEQFKAPTPFWGCIMEPRACSLMNWGTSKLGNLVQLTNMIQHKCCQSVNPVSRNYCGFSHGQLMYKEMGVLAAKWSNREKRISLQYGLVGRKWRWHEVAWRLIHHIDSSSIPSTWEQGVTRQVYLKHYHIHFLQCSDDLVLIRCYIKTIWILSAWTNIIIGQLLFSLIAPSTESV